MIKTIRTTRDNAFFLNSHQQQQGHPHDQVETLHVQLEKPRSKLFFDNPQPYIHPTLFLHWFQKLKLEEQFSKFLDVFEKLHIDIPIVGTVEQSLVI